jgi:ATP-dependent Lon protease
MAMEAGKNILLVAQKSAAKDEPEPEDLYRIGCMANILQMLKLPDGTVKVLVEGTQRARVEAIEVQILRFMANATPGRNLVEGSRSRGHAPRRDCPV